MSLSLLEAAFIMNVFLILTDSLSFFHAVYDLSSEFDLLELILANGRNNFSCGSNLHGLRHF